MHCCLVQSRSLRKQKKKILQVPPVTSFLNTSCTFSSNNKRKTRASWPPAWSGSPDRQGARGQAACLLQRVNSTQLQRSPLLSGAGYTHKPSPICIQWGLFSHTREKNRLLCKPKRLPYAGAGATTEWGRERRDPERQLQNTKRTRRRRREKPQPRGDPLPPGASIPTGTTNPTLTSALAARFCAPSAGSQGQWPPFPCNRRAARERNPPGLPVRSLLLTVLAASAQVLPFFLRPFSLMSGVELTGRLPCPGCGRPPCLLCPALFFPRCRERWEKGEVRPEEHPSRGSGGGGARGAVYGAAGPPAAVTTATAAAILGPYCTGSRYGHVTAPARPSLLYAAGRANERARAPASRAGMQGERAGQPPRLATPPPSALRLA